VSELDFLLKRKEGRSEESSAQGRGSGDGERGAQTHEPEVQAPESVKNQPGEEGKVKEIMVKFLGKDPKIGVWSYPAFLVLQYLYNTIPGFKVSKVAKEALEAGLKQIYPDLFREAEEIVRTKGREFQRS
jgi:hypothetical protein